MPNFEYALLALLMVGLITNTGTLLLISKGRYYSTSERLCMAGLGFGFDIALLVSCLLWY